jgi:hypothetical protein
MILAAHQPAYLPWLGYLDKIARADVFVFMDTVQFEKNSFINRNRIKTPQGAQWLTVPVRTKGHLTATLRTTEIDAVQHWRDKHLGSIAMNYRRTPYFERCFPKLQALLMSAQLLLSELCWQQLAFWLAELAIGTRTVRASELPVGGTKSELVLSYCRHFGARHYISGPLGRDYLVESDFSAAGITIEYQDYQHPIYPQLWGEFLPCMSIVDAWMNCGADTITLLERRR